MAKSTVTIGRVIPKKIPVCPGRDSRYTVRHNADQSGTPWWVYYECPTRGLLPADQDHRDLVTLVNELKQQICGSEGGSFSLNEHGQVIARMPAPSGSREAAVHAI